MSYQGTSQPSAMPGPGSGPQYGGAGQPQPMQPNFGATVNPAMYQAHVARNDTPNPMAMSPAPFNPALAQAHQPMSMGSPPPMPGNGASGFNMPFLQQLMNHFLGQGGAGMLGQPNQPQMGGYNFSPHGPVNFNQFPQSGPRTF